MVIQGENGSGLPPYRSARPIPPGWSTQFVDQVHFFDKKALYLLLLPQKGSALNSQLLVNKLEKIPPCFPLFPVNSLSDQD